MFSLLTRKMVPDWLRPIFFCEEVEIWEKARAKTTKLTFFCLANRWGRWSPIDFRRSESLQGSGNERGKNQKVFSSSPISGYYVTKVKFCKSWWWPTYVTNGGWWYLFVWHFLKEEPEGLQFITNLWIQCHEGKILPVMGVTNLCAPWLLCNYGLVVGWYLPVW